MKRVFLMILTVVFCIASCDKQDRENTYTAQEGQIDSYISSLDDSYRVVRNSGANRVVLVEGSGTEQLQAGDSLYFIYSAYIFSNGKGTLYSTNDTTVAKTAGIQTDGEPKKMIYGKDALIKGLYYGLDGVRTEEQCYIIFSAKYGYGNQIMFNLPKLTPLFFDIKVKKIVKN